MGWAIGITKRVPFLWCLGNGPTSWGFGFHRLCNARLIVVNLLARERAPVVLDGVVDEAAFRIVVRILLIPQRSREGLRMEGFPVLHLPHFLAPFDILSLRGLKVPRTSRPLRSLGWSWQLRTRRLDHFNSLSHPLREDPHSPLSIRLPFRPIHKRPHFLHPVFAEFFIIMTALFHGRFFHGGVGSEKREQRSSQLVVARHSCAT